MAQGEKCPFVPSTSIYSGWPIRSSSWTLISNQLWRPADQCIYQRASFHPLCQSRRCRLMSITGWTIAGDRAPASFVQMLRGWIFSRDRNCTGLTCASMSQSDYWKSAYPLGLSICFFNRALCRSFWTISTTDQILGLAQHFLLLHEKVSLWKWSNNRMWCLGQPIRMAML